MSFITGTQAELLYAMPASGASSAPPGAASVILSGNTTTNPGYQLPALATIWPINQLPGKVIGVRARGIFGTPAATPGTWVVGCGLNTTQATKPTTIVLAATGAFTPAAPILSIANGGWEMEFDMVITSVGTAAGAAPNAVINTSGNFNLGAGNNAATTTNVGYQVGAAGITTVNPVVSYWIEMYATFSTGPASTQIQATQFLVFGYS